MEEKPADVFEKSIMAAKRGASAYEVWQGFVYIAAYEIAASCNQDCSEFEGMYRASIERFKPAEGDLRQAFTALVAMLDENPYQDALGDMYMRLGIGNEAGGQFFTPFHVSKLLARINLSKATQTIAEQGYITISEPSCGAGANVIACCAAMADMGIDWQRQAVFECQDISVITALMGYVQLSLIGAAARVVIGDTLAGERRIALSTPVFMVEPVWVARSMGGDVFGC